MTLDQLIAAINGLDANQKAELTAKISASADKRQAFKTLRAARSSAYNEAVVDQMLGTARRLGVAHVIKEDSVVSLDELNRELKGKDRPSKTPTRKAMAGTTLETRQGRG
jgi:hypothetical protein